MNIIYSDLHLAHQPNYEIYDGRRSAYPEVAARVDSIITELRRLGIGRITKPTHFPLRHIYAVHQKQYVDFLRQCSKNLANNEELYPSYFISDTYAPLTPGTFKASLTAVDCALSGAQKILSGQPIVYSLCRPPGHHAAHHTMGGYCYFNNAAIAAEFLANHGSVAILDIDFHHGNGTQAAFYNRRDVLYLSIHADPAQRYPYSSGFSDECGSGPGEGFNFNYPLDLATTNSQYLAVLDSCLSEIKKFNPDFLVVSAGFDTFIHDPIGGFALTQDVYREIGARIGSLKLPTLIIQEGGYNVEYLGKLIGNFLSGFKLNQGSF
ncbi:hypothetical protein A3F65_02185 [Candidatus Saccharibacteria bacterium RIFCSPHIGHO2_12_FULL_47_16b]|nr:MAG: hypothetical protein A3F65_02185 [Candidatus Saccharibacteria bacterium RIFCSPHIGHO2_12_FULL_47_16b]